MRHVERSDVAAFSNEGIAVSALKAFELHEELYAAETAEQARSLHVAMCGDEDSDEARELSEAELDAPQPEFGEDEQPTGGTTTIRQMLAEHGDEPGWLAGPAY